jgi:hypothetical protein
MAPEQAREARSTGTASDVFSLGSTLLYAATGHAPYQGETTVDVLVRLATEPPDLTGLPPELVDPLARCLDRDPDRRPTPAQLVARIAATMRFEGNDGPRSLPPRAVEMIEDHRRRPLPAEPVAGEHPSLPGQEETLGSRAGQQHPSFPPATQLPGPVASGGAHRADPAQGADPADGTDPGQRTDPARRADRRLAIVLACLAAVLLVGGGLEIGSRLANNDNGAAAQQQAGLGPPRGGPGQAPPRPPPGDTAAKPDITVNQPFGDARTTFVVSGRGWQPDTTVTLTLDGHPVVPKAPATDKQGAFNYTLNQGQEMYPAGLPAGRHTVQATGNGGQKAVIDFDVG